MVRAVSIFKLDAHISAPEYYKARCQFEPMEAAMEDSVPAAPDEGSNGESVAAEF